MAIVPIALTSKSSPARYKQGGAAVLTNCFVEQIGEEGKTPWAIYACDGLQGFATAFGASGGIRAMLPVGSYLYFVAGTGMFRMSATGNVQLIGSMNISTTAPVYMARNRRETPDVAVVCDGLMYYYRTTFQQVTDVDLLAPVSLTFVDGYFVIGTTQNTWQIGAIDDASAWNGLDFERADSNPDDVVRVASLQRDAVIFGEVSTEFWRNTGAADFPFERVAANDIGCLAPDSVVTIDGTLAWVANDRTVRMLSGYDGRRISTHAIERDIESLANPETISATVWTKDGHTFYALTCDEWTWVYDTITGLWHTRRSTVDGVDLLHWRINKVAEFAGLLIAGDRDDPNLYEMSATYADEAGNPIKMMATLPPVHAYPLRLTFNAVHLDVEKGGGVGVGAIEDVTPEMILRVSRDGGHTFAAERRLPVGKQGARTQRIRTHRLGQATPDGLVFQIEAPTRTVRALYQMQADVDREA